MSWRKSSIVLVMAAVGLALATPLFAEILPVNTRPQVLYPTKMDVSQPLRTIAPLPIKAGVPHEIINRQPAKPGLGGGTDPVVQNFPGQPNVPAPLSSYEGLGNLNGVAPPDTEGDVGLTQYFQWINLSFAIYDKATGAILYGPAAGNTFWSGFGGSCQTDNDGDPIVLYDNLADRWFVQQFSTSTPYKLCAAVSTTGDPTGSWYRYQYTFSNSKFPDYHKVGLWPDAYYVGFNQFLNLASWAGAGALAFDRAAMIAGSPTAATVYFDLFTVNSNFGNMFPADLDGPNPPPAGTPGQYFEWDDAAWLGDATDTLRRWEFHVDWANPANSTFGLAGLPNQLIATADSDPNMCGYARACIPQPGTTWKVDAISDRLMYRIQYRNFGTHETFVMTHTVDADGADHAGARWYELRNTGGAGWVVNQQGTFAPDTTNRWMGSIAMDAVGNIALGYSASDATSVYPSVRYTGREVADTPGTMGAEQVLVAGGGSQLDAANRWGDYSAMSVDPSDDCTFWYTQEYVAVGGSWVWNTRFGSFKFPSCVAGPSGVIHGTVISSTTSLPIAGAAVVAGAYNTVTDGSGLYSLSVAPGTYDVTASKFGYSPSTATGIVVADGDNILQDFSLTPVGTYSVDGFVTGDGHAWPLWAKIEIKQGATLVQTVYTSPWNGYYEALDLPNGFIYDFTVHSMYVGYQDEVRPVAVAGADQTQNFSLLAASGNPAYSCVLQGGVNEDFNAAFPPLGWTVKNNGSIPGNVWKRNDVWGRANLTLGTGFAAAADSDIGGAHGAFNTELWSPPIAMPASPRNLRFKSAFKRYIGDVGTLDVSTTGGASWTNLLTLTTTAVTEPTVNMGVYASQTIILRWKYTSGDYEYYWQIDDVRTETMPAPPPLSQAFEGTFPPTGWTVVNNTANVGNVWKRNDVWGEINFTGGTGFCAAASSDKAGPGSGAFDTELRSPSIAMPATPFSLTFKSNLRRYSTDTGYLDVSTTGGASWTNLLTITVTEVAPHTVDLTAYASQTIILRWRYTSGDWEYRWQIDDVTVGVSSTPVVDTPTLVCQAVAGSMVAGFVTDANTAAGLLGAQVVCTTSTSQPCGMATTMDATGNLPIGFYYMFSPAVVPPLAPNGPSTRTFTASKTGYGTVEHSVNLVPDTINQIDFALPAAALSLANWPFVIDGRLTPDGLPAWDKTDSFSILNTGGLDAYVKLFAQELASGYVPPMPRGPAGPLTMAPEFIARNPFSLKGIPLLIQPTNPAPSPLAAGDVITSWATGLALPWGCGITGDTVWASNPSAGGGDDYNYEFTATGTPTGRKVQAVFGGSWAADMSRADGAGMLWQINVGGDNCIYELDPAVGMTGNKICPAFGTSERGLAYDPDTDSFFAGSWNDLTIKRFDRTGAILQQVNVGLAIAGLAYNPSTQHLFVMENAAPNTVTVLDVANGYATVGSFTIAGFGDYSGAGIEFGCDGLWAMNQGDGNAYLVDAGEMYPCNPNLPWFVMTPTEGSVPSSGQLDIGAEFFPEGVAPAHYGLFRAQINSTNDTPNALPAIPVYMTKAFWDVPRGYWADAFIHALAGVRITKGCGEGNFCPENNVSRADMAILMVHAIHGPDFAPPPAVGIFVDVPISDTDNTANFIEQLYNDGVVAGCAVGGGGEKYYCPNDLVNRAQMSVFICAGLGIPPVAPPTGYFTDVSGTGYAWAEGYVEAIFNEGITAGCGDHLFCPGDNITRAQLSVWLTVGLNLPYYVHPLAP